MFPQAPFPLRVTRVVTAVLPSSLVARRVSVEDPPPELDNPLPEQIPPEMQQRLAEQNKKMLNKPPRRLLLEGPDQNQDQPIKRTNRQQHQGVLRSPKRVSRSESSRSEPTETPRNRGQDQAGVGNGSESLDVRVRKNEVKWNQIHMTEAQHSVERWFHTNNFLVHCSWYYLISFWHNLCVWLKLALLLHCLRSHRCHSCMCKN